MLLIFGRMGRGWVNLAGFNDKAGQSLMSYKRATTINILALMIALFRFSA